MYGPPPCNGRKHTDSDALLWPKCCENQLKCEDCVRIDDVRDPHAPHTQLCHDTELRLSRDCQRRQVQHKIHCFGFEALRTFVNTEKSQLVVV